MNYDLESLLKFGKISDRLHANIVKQINSFVMSNYYNSESYLLVLQDKISPDELFNFKKFVYIQNNLYEKKKNLPIDKELIQKKAIKYLCMLFNETESNIRKSITKVKSIIPKGSYESKFYKLL